MTDKAPKPKLGRPKKKFSVSLIKKIEYAAFCQSKDYTISEAYGIDDKTFKAHFSERCSQKRAEGKLWLQRKQHGQADKSNIAMLCFLGKNYLEQADKQELTHNVGEDILDFMKWLKDGSNGDTAGHTEE